MSGYLSKFKELLYNLNMQLKYPGIRTRYMDGNSIQYIVDEIKAVVRQDWSRSRV